MDKRTSLEPLPPTAKSLKERLELDSTCTSLGLGLVPAFSDNPSCHTQPPSSQPQSTRAGLKGGAEPPSGPVMSTISSLSGITTAAFEDYVLNFFAASPITTLQITAGLGLHIFDMVGIVPYRSILFHPRLVLSPYWQGYRAVSSFFVLGLSGVDVVQRAVGSVYYQAPLETWMNGSGDTYRNGRLIHEGRQRLIQDGSSSTSSTLGIYPFSGAGQTATSSSSTSSSSTQPAQQQPVARRKRKNVFEWLLTDNRFLHSQIISIGTLVLIELFLNEAVPSLRPQPVPGSASSYLIFPYSLYPHLEYATRWTWALTTMDREVILFGVLPVKPQYLPIVLCGMGGFTQWKSLVKGLAAALLVSQVMGLKRFDGEPVVEATYRLAMDWYYWIEGIVKQVNRANAANRGDASRPTVSAASSSSSASASVGTGQPAPAQTTPRLTELPIDGEVVSVLAGAFGLRPAASS